MISSTAPMIPIPRMMPIWNAVRIADWCLVPPGSPFTLLGLHDVCACPKKRMRRQQSTCHPRQHFPCSFAVPGREPAHSLGHQHPRRFPWAQARDPLRELWYAPRALPMVVQLDLPAPLRVVGGVPPLDERPDLATRQEHQPADVLRRRPDILALDAITMPCQAGDGRIVRLFQVFALGQNTAIAATHGDGQGGWRGVNQQDIGALDTAARREGRLRLLRDTRDPTLASSARPCSTPLRTDQRPTISDATRCPPLAHRPDRQACPGGSRASAFSTSARPSQRVPGGALI